MKITMRNEGDRVRVSLSLGGLRRRLNFLMKKEVECVRLCRWHYVGGIASEGNSHKLLVQNSVLEKFRLLFDSTASTHYVFNIYLGSEQEFVTNFRDFISAVNREVAKRLTTYVVTIKDNLDKSIDEKLIEIEEKESDLVVEKQDPLFVGIEEDE
jgi:hypothetical protein